jgi:hypothetical protein
MHRAGAASGHTATEFGTRQVHFVAQHPEQGCAGVGLDLSVLAVDVQLHGVFSQECGAILRQLAHRHASQSGVALGKDTD